MNQTKVSRRVLAAGLLSAAGRNLYIPTARGDPVPIFSRGAMRPTMQKTHQLSAENYVNSVAWNADESLLAVLSNFGGAVSIFKAPDWQEINAFKRYGDAYSGNSFAFLPDGTLLTTAAVAERPADTERNEAILSLMQWDPSTGLPMRYIPDTGYPAKQPSVKLRPANYFVVSAGGRFVAGINGPDVLIFQVSDWSLLMRFTVPPTPTHPDYPVSVAVSPDSRLLIVGAGFGYVHVYRMGDVTPACSFIPFPGDMFHYCGSLAFSPDGEYLATGRGGVSVGEADDGWIRIWRTSDWLDIIHLDGGAGSVRSLAWTANGSRLAAGDDRSLRVWRMSVSPPDLEIHARTDSSVYSVAFSMNGRLAAAAGNTVDIYK